MAEDPVPVRAAATVQLRSILVGVSLLMIAVGAGIYLAVDETIGAVIAALGVLDLLTIPLVLGMIRRGAQSSAADPAPSPKRGMWEPT